MVLFCNYKCVMSCYVTWCYMMWYYVITSRITYDIRPLIFQFYVDFTVNKSITLLSFASIIIKYKLLNFMLTNNFKLNTIWRIFFVRNLLPNVGKFILRNRIPYSPVQSYLHVLYLRPWIFLSKCTLRMFRCEHVTYVQLWVRYVCTAVSTLRMYSCKYMCVTCVWLN